MRANWKELYEEVRQCQRCGLCAQRTQVVVGRGSATADIMFVGEGPGREEDKQGLPFVGPAGQLLDKMIAAMELSQEQAYICNIVKCRPPNNREPADDEAKACLPYLRAQFVLVRPKIVVALGRVAAKHIYSESIRITKDRGVWKESAGVFIMPTYHPAALLRDPAKKKEAWVDLQAVMQKYAVLKS